MPSGTRRLSLLKDYVILYKMTSVCADCGNGDWRVLEFDHRNPLNKSFTISHAICHGGVGILKLVTEIEKCDVVCANCHKIRHYKNPVNQLIYLVRETRSRPGGAGKQI